jgi:hypothetical protein
MEFCVVQSAVNGTIVEIISLIGRGEDGCQAGVLVAANATATTANAYRFNS